MMTTTTTAARLATPVAPCLTFQTAPDGSDSGPNKVSQEMCYAHDKAGSSAGKSENQESKNEKREMKDEQRQK